MSNYYISKPDGTQEGPYDKTTLISLVKNHTYSPDSYIWREGMAEWKPFREVFTAKKKAPRPASPAPMTAHPAQKKKMKGLMIGIIAGALLATGGVTYWLMSDDEANTELDLPQQINSVEELYKLFEKGLPSYTNIVYGQSDKILNAIMNELSSSSTDFAYVQMGLIVLNHSGATEFFIKNYHLDEFDSARFLQNALRLGAHNVAKVLIDKGGYKLSWYWKAHVDGGVFYEGKEYDNSDDLIANLVEVAANINSPGRRGYFDIMYRGEMRYHRGVDREMNVTEGEFVKNRNWQKCAELAIERLGCPVTPPSYTNDATLMKDGLNKLKLMGKEKPLTDYISSKM